MKQLILVADDSKTVQNAMQLALDKHEQFQTIIASHANEALEILQNQNIALILADHNLPGKNGYSLARETSVPTMILCSQEKPYDMQRAMSHGSIGFINKPFDITELLLGIENGLSESLENQALSNENNIKNTNTLSLPADTLEKIAKNAFLVLEH